MPRWLAVDYGQRRLGLALSDALLITAKGLPTWDRGKTAAKATPSQREASLLLAVEHVLSLIRQHGVERVIVGNPLSLRGEPTAMGDEAASFTQYLRTVLSAQGLDEVVVDQFDERLTSKLAESNLVAGGKKASRDKGSIDQEAARLLLLDYIAYQGG